MRPAELLGRRDDDHLPRAGAGHFFEHADQRGRPVGEPMRLATPVALRRKPDQLRVGRHRQGQRAGHRVEDVVARRAGQVHRLGGSTVEPGGLPPQEERAPPVAAQQRKHQVLARVQVVRDDQQLAKSGLAQVVGQQLGVAPAQVRPRGLLDAGAAAEQVPQAGDEVVDGGRRRERRAKHRPPDAAAQRRAGPAPTRARATRRQDDRHHDHGQHGRHDLRARGSAARRARRPPAAPPPIAAPATRRCRCPPRRAGPRSDTRRRPAPAPAAARRSTAAATVRPATTRRSAARQGYKPSHAATSPQARGLPQPRRAVDGGKQRRHRAHAAAGDQVDADAGLVQRAHGASVIRAVDAAAGEHQRGAPVGGVVG